MSALLGQVVISGMTEGYCILFPGIGTRFAPGYSERGFNAVRPGMSEQEVIALIGKPLSEGSQVAPSGRLLAKAGDIVWAYSIDTNGRDGDWAWLSREVVFRNGRVAHAVKWIYYD